jgi:hypothetical protein
MPDKRGREKKAHDHRSLVTTGLVNIKATVCCSGAIPSGDPKVLISKSATFATNKIIRDYFSSKIELTLDIDYATSKEMILLA